MDVFFVIRFVSIFSSAAKTTDACDPCAFLPIFHLQCTKCQFQDFRLQHFPKVSHVFQP